MTRLDSIIQEFDQEVRTSRRHLERLREEHFDWRPHEKSFSAGQLGGHITECIRWADQVFAQDELTVDESTYVVIRPTSVGTLLDVFDETVEKAMRSMNSSSDFEVSQPWRLTSGEKVLFEKSRDAAFRDLSLSHLIHHRGQLTVYLRLLDIPLVGTYGPTADQHG